eukprot:4259321-Pleurochrysis_carterae.AAC.1
MPAAALACEGTFAWDNQAADAGTWTCPKITVARLRARMRCMVREQGTPAGSCKDRTSLLVPAPARMTTGILLPYA